MDYGGECNRQNNSLASGRNTSTVTMNSGNIRRDEEDLK